MTKARLEVTNSELNAFRTCRQRWWFRYEQQLRPKRKPTPLTVGSCIHAGIGGMYHAIDSLQVANGINGNQRVITGLVDTDWLTQEAMIAMSAKCGEAVERIMASVDDPEEALEECKLVEQQAASSVERFVAAFGEEDARRYIVVAVEQPFNVPLLDDAGTARSAIRLAGVMDCIKLDQDMDEYVLDEHKSTKGDAMYADLKLDLDPQTGLYVYAMRHLLKRDGVEPKVGRVHYNVVRKGGPKKPKLNKDGTVSVAKVETTKELYLEALEEVGAPEWAAEKPEKWEKVRAKQLQFAETLPGDGRYASRHETYHGPAAVDRCRRDAHADARVMRWTKHSKDPLPVTRNTNACNPAWMPRCAYRSICIEDSAEKREAGFDVADARHTEVKEAEEDLAAAQANGDPVGQFGF